MIVGKGQTSEVFVGTSEVPMAMVSCGEQQMMMAENPRRSWLRALQRGCDPWLLASHSK